jgi:hypothetical protein
MMPKTEGIEGIVYRLTMREASDQSSKFLRVKPSRSQMPSTKKGLALGQKFATPKAEAGPLAATLQGDSKATLTSVHVPILRYSLIY